MADEPQPLDEQPGAVPPPPSPAAPESTPRPWGVWATLGWMVLIAGGYLAAQAAALTGVLTVTSKSGSGRFPAAGEIEGSGLELALATILSAPIAIGLAFLFAWLRKNIQVRDYLALHWPPWRTVAKWCLLLLGVFLLNDFVISPSLNRPLVPEVMVEMYRSAGIPILFWIAVVIAAPAAEEIVFRGFFFAGLRGRGHSVWRNGCAVLITAASWAAIHFQYDAFDVTVIFIAGILLGCARLRTGSVPLCILMHLLTNLVSTIETVLLA